MSALLLATQRTAQPQGPIAVDYGNPLARGLVFAINPAAGGVNLARSNWPSVNTELVRSTSASVLLSSGAANYSQSINNANGLTLFSILRSRDASQYLFSDGERSILSARNASNQGWTWSRTGAADIGGSRGNATRQAFTLNGIAAYSEANATIESFADVPVALRYVKSTGVISWFSNGRKSSNDTNGSTGGTVGGDLVFRRQGPYANNLQPYIDKTGLTLVFEQALSDAEIAAISANPWQLFKPVERRIWVPASTGGSTVYSLPLAAGSYTLTGQAATLTPTFHRSLALAAGAYSLIGQTVDLIYVPGSGAYGLTLDAGQYTLAGQALATRVERHLTTATGVFALAGGAVGLTVARHLAASAGTYVITGQDIVLTFVGATHYSLTLDAGTYTVQGQDIVLRGPTTEVAYRGAYAPDMSRRKREKVDRVIDDVVAVLEAQNVPERVVRRAKSVVHRVARVRQAETLAELDAVVALAKVEDAVTRVLHKAIKQAKATRRRKQDEELLLVL